VRAVRIDEHTLAHTSFAVPGHTDLQVLDNNVSGLVVTVVYDQQTLWTKGYGTSNPFSHPRGAPPDGSQLVRVASITKTFTSMLAFVMRDSGVVGLDEDVRTHVPTFDVQSPYAVENVTTLRQLASHTSGLPRDLGFPCGFNPACSDAEVYVQPCLEHSACERRGKQQS
jgi:CubicO group peptidase (beta-lactamase class C family)